MKVRGFFDGDPGPCPICGTPHSACIDDSNTVPHNVIRTYNFARNEPRRPVRFRSKERVYEMDARGRKIMKYGLGAEIPLMEAIHQGQVRAKDLTAADKESLKLHLAKGIITVSELKGFLTAPSAEIKGFLTAPPADKQLRTSDVVTK